MTKLPDVARWFFRLFLKLWFSSEASCIRVCKLRGRMQLVWESEHVGRKIALHMFERPETRFLENSVQTGNVCLDIGANVGYFSQLFASLNKGAPVLAIEPVHRNAELVRFNALVNNYENIQVYECAVGDEEGGEVEFAVCGDSAFSSRLFGDKRPASFNPLAKNDSKIVVPTITVDALLSKEGISQVDILKMDIEGGELRALKGMEQLLADKQKSPRLMLIEIVSSHLQYFGDSIEDVCEYLKSFGYYPEVINGGCRFPYGPEQFDVYTNVIFTRRKTEYENGHRYHG